MAIKVAVSLVFILALCAHILTKVKLDAIGLTLLALAVLPWLIPLLWNYVRSVELFGTKIELLESEVLAQRELVKVLLDAAEHNLTIYEADHLRNLGRSSMQWTGNPFLRCEMIRLCQHGFVAEMPERSVWEIPETNEPCDMNALVHINEKGKEHIQLIENLRNMARAGHSKRS